MKYALIKNSVVVNIVKSDNTDLLDDWILQDAIDSYVELTNEVVSPGDVYSGGNFSKASLTLPQAKAKKLTEFKASIDGYLDEHYPLVTRVQLVNLYILARLDSLTNRAAYLAPGVDWLHSIIEYSATFAASVQAQVDVQTTLNMTWDIESNVGPDPLLTLSTAIQIVD